jgi:hypothetical protein
MRTAQSVIPSAAASAVPSALRCALFAAVLATVFPTAGFAQAPGAAALAVVEAVQYPAWMEREGRPPVPLAVGMRLESKDRLRTGGNARVLLRMPEGSTVKLGENARYRIDFQQRQGNVYAAAMNVLEGAFRFTTDALRPFRGKRDVRISFPTVTAGIRGTDVWGKSAPEREIVCLIEGVVEVERGGDQPVLLDKPLLFYVAPKDGPAEPVGPVPPEQLKQWAAETEIQPGSGAARRGGRWKLALGSVATQAEALALYDAVRAAGYPARILPRDVDGKHVFELRLTGLPSRAEAQALAQAVAGRFGVGEPLVYR